jgi:UDP-2,4-diacetamido-2,4,6-trideoxy-beta-L-altropyranose hydrolase
MSSPATEFSVESGTLLLRADASERTGTGHIMRMLALAQAWQDRGGQTVLAAVSCPDALAQRLAAEKVRLHILPNLPIGSEQDAFATRAVALQHGADCVALDGYAFGETMQTNLREAGFTVLAMDDFGHSSRWHAQVVLNQNFDAADRFYDCVNSDTQILRGPAFALLRREFRLVADNTDHDQSPSRLLVTFGGADPQNTSGAVLEVLNQVATQPCDIRVLVGVANPHLKDLQRGAAKSPHNVELIQHCTDMPGMYAWADRIISAAGSSCYEWMRFGLPAAVVVIADNQEPIAKWLGAHQAATVLGTANSDWDESLHAWLRCTNPNRPPANLIDAKGALRVADALRYVSAQTSREALAHV